MNIALLSKTFASLNLLEKQYGIYVPAMCAASYQLIASYYPLIVSYYLLRIVRNDPLPMSVTHSRWSPSVVIMRTCLLLYRCQKCMSVQVNRSLDLLIANPHCLPGNVAKLKKLTISLLTYPCSTHGWHTQTLFSSRQPTQTMHVHVE